MGRLMEDSGFMERFVETHRQDRTLLEKLRDAFRELARKLTGKYRTLAGKAERRLTEAMEAAAKVVEMQSGQGYTGTNDTRYSLKEDIESGKARKESRVSYHFLFKNGFIT